MSVSFKMNQGETITATFTAGGGTMGLKLVVPTTSERWRLSFTSRLTGENPEFAKMLEELASSWWVGFVGAVDSEGVEIPDTTENRFRLLQASEKLTTFVIGALTAEEEKVAEGKDVSVSA